MQYVYLLVFVYENGASDIQSVHADRQGAEWAAERWRAEKRSDIKGLWFDYCHVVERPFHQ